MKKLIKASLLLFCLLFLSYNGFSQSNKKEEIAKKLNDYFFLERENMFVHLDKNVFLTNDDVWFKGYVFHRKKNTPFFACVNIFASLINEEGTILETQLLYGDMGSFSGSFKLNDNMKSGKYYLQFYTNWMNNFTEDESAVYEITVINEVTGIPSLNPVYSEVTINIHPEGGTLLQGVTNNVGINVSGCNNTRVVATEAEVINSKGEIIKKVPLNKSGYGRFDFIPGSTETYKIAVTVNGQKHEQILPAPELKGISLEVNSYAFADKTPVKIRANKATLEAFAGKPLYIIIHKDEKATVAEFTLNNAEQAITLPNSDFFEGLNTIRIVDSDLNQLAERLIYLYPQSVLNTQLSKVKEGDGTVEFTGKINNPNMSLSVSVLPASSVSVKATDDIYGGLLIAPYLENNKSLALKQYLDNNSRSSKYELDLFLLSQQSKYKWRDILKNPPKNNYTFEIGLALKGTINQTIKNRKDYKVRVSSLQGMINETVEINNKNEFYLTNLIMPDSAKMTFSLMNGGVKVQDLKLYPQVSNNNRKFNKPYKPQVAVCTLVENAVTADSPELPKYAINSIMIEEVEVNAKPSIKLKHEKAFGNSMLRGYKITESDSRSFMFILDFIRYHGFNVSVSGSDVSITGRTINTINGQPTMPMVYVDNVRLIDFSFLLGIQTEDIDEFYINPHAVVPSVDNKMGIVRMYMKRNFAHKQKDNPDVTFMIKDGFEPIPVFKNSDYISTRDEGFENFGLIDWEPQVTTNEKGEFTLSIPKVYSGQVKVLIEGIGPDGKLISEIKTITL